MGGSSPPQLRIWREHQLLFMPSTCTSCPRNTAVNSKLPEKHLSIACHIQRRPFTVHLLQYWLKRIWKFIRSSTKKGNWHHATSQATTRRRSCHILSNCHGPADTDLYDLKCFWTFVPYCSGVRLLIREANVDRETFKSTDRFWARQMSKRKQSLRRHLEHKWKRARCHRWPRRSVPLVFLRGHLVYSMSL